MDKKGNNTDTRDRVKNTFKLIKRSYLYKLVTRVLSVVCTIILVLLLVVGALMFYFNTKAKSYTDRGLDYNAPFGLYTIISGSMEPNVSVYDVVIAVEQDISKIKVGDIITFISSWDINYGVTVTHRVVGISKTATGEFQLTTKGDNNGSADGGIVTQTNLIGKVVGRIPQLGRLQFFLATKMGWFLVVFIPALGIIIFDMLKLFKLYVLKGEIENVKTPKEAERDEMIDKLKSSKKPLQELNNKAIQRRDLIEKLDKTIDTVELPKVGADGRMTENTKEMRLSDKLNVSKSSLNDDIPMIKNTTNELDIPKLNPERKMLKRRDK